MKLQLKITGIFLVFALLTSCAVATENKDLPTKEEIIYFIAGIPVSDNYIITVFNAVKDKQPAWSCDTWVDQNGNQILSLYYVDPDSAKGYGSIYFNELGKEISIRGVEAKLVNHYVGEAVSVDTNTADTNNGSTEEQSVEDERLAEYEERLATYEKKLNEYDDKSQSVENVAYKVESVAKTVENTSQSVENTSQSVEYKDNPVIEIRDGVFVAVVGGVIVCIIESFLKKKRGKKSNL